MMEIGDKVLAVDTIFNNEVMWVSGVIYNIEYDKDGTIYTIFIERKKEEMIRRVKHYVFPMGSIINSLVAL